MLARITNIFKTSTFTKAFHRMQSSIPPQQTTKDLVIIRHAQSNFNKGFMDYKELKKLDLSWDEFTQFEDFNQSVSYAKEFIDCSITEKGKQQCRAAREMLANEEIDIVLVSPLERTLETCYEIFNGKNVKVEVHPILAEVFRYSCDIGSHRQEKEKRFPDYDFSFMQDHSELWFIDNLSEHLKHKCNSHFQPHGEMTFVQKQQKLLELMQSKVIYESPQELRMRTWKIKELLGEYKKKYKKIAIVSHFYTLTTLRASKFNEIGQVIDPQEIYNARPIFDSIDRLLSIK